MPALVRTSLFMALVMPFAMLVMPNIAQTDEFDDVGVYGDPLDDTGMPALAPTPRAQTTPPQTPPNRAPSNRPGVLRPAFINNPTNSGLGKPLQPPPKTPNLSRSQIPPRTSSPSHYTRSVRKMIRAHNRTGRSVGDIKLFAKEGRWGSAVKIQSCYGDNILTRFLLSEKGDTERVWFQFKDATYRNRRRRRHRWLMVEPGFLMRGRHIFLRAQSSKGNDVLSIKVLGNCINSPASP